MGQPRAAANREGLAGACPALTSARFTPNERDAALYCELGMICMWSMLGAEEPGHLVQTLRRPDDCHQITHFQPGVAVGNQQACAAAHR